MTADGKRTRRSQRRRYKNWSVVAAVYDCRIEKLTLGAHRDAAIRTNFSGIQLLVDADKKTITITIMKTVSIQEMRFEFAGVRAALEAGEELILTFRNRPLARLLPFASAKTPEGIDSALQFGDEPENLEPLNNNQVDALIYG